MDDEHEWGYGKPRWRWPRLQRCMLPRVLYFLSLLSLVLLWHRGVLFSQRVVFLVVELFAKCDGAASAPHEHDANHFVGSWGSSQRCTVSP